MIGKILLALGILGILLGVAVTGISAILPVVTDGRTSWEEALLGIIPGVAVLFFSFVLAVTGTILVIIGRKKNQ